MESELEIEHTLDRFYEIEPQISEPLDPEPEADIIDSLTQELAETNELTETIPPVDKEQNPLTQLRHQLEQAILCEDYEEAIRLRDAIEVLVNKTEP